MESYPKTRSPLGTYIAVTDQSGEIYLARLSDWLLGMFPKGRIHAVALTKGPLKKWIRSYEFHKPTSRLK